MYVMVEDEVDDADDDWRRLAASSHLSAEEWGWATAE